MSFFRWTTDSIKRSDSPEEVTVGVHSYSSRKRPTLVAHHPTWTEALAYFKDEESARLFCAVLGLKITERGDTGSTRP